MNRTIETDRLILRSTRISDAPRVTEIVTDPRIYENVARIAPKQTEAETTAWLETHAQGDQAGTDHVFAITEPDERLIGMIGLHRSETQLPFELGYWIAPDFWGKGYTTEAGHALLHWMEQMYDYGLTVSGHFADNPASGRVLAKLGFMYADRGPVFCLGRACEVDHFYMARITDSA